MEKLVRLVALMLILVALAAPPATATTKYAACSKLTAAEIEALLKAKVARTVDQDIVIDKGPYKGEIQSNCAWVFAAGGAVSVAIVRAPRTPQERDESLTRLRGALDTLKQKGWTIQSTKVGSASCMHAVPPAGEEKARPVSGCLMESRGLALSVFYAGPASVTVEQVASLAGKVASRLP